MTISEEAPVDPAIDPDLVPPEIRRLVGEPEEVPDEDQVPEITVLTDEERRDLTTLITVGRRVKTITVMNHKVKIQTLKSTDEMRIGLFTKPYLGSQGFARAYQVAMCAAGIIEVDGAPLYSSIRQEKDPDALFAKRAEQMEQFYPVVVSQIYDAISDLEKEFSELAEKLGKSPG